MTGIKKNKRVGLRELVAAISAGAVFCSGCSFSPPANANVFEQDIEEKINSTIRSGDYEGSARLLRDNSYSLDDCYESSAWGTWNYFLAEDLEKDGSLEEAKNYYEAAARQLLNLRDDANCTDEWEESARIELYYYISRSCNKIGHYRTALNTLRELDELNDFSRDPLYNLELGNALFGTGNLLGARVAYKEALAIAGSYGKDWVIKEAREGLTEVNRLLEERNK